MYIKLVKELYCVTQPFSLILFWHIFFDYGIYKNFIPYISTTSMFLIGLAIFFGSIIISIFLICKATMYIPSSDFYLLNFSNLVFSYIMSDKFYKIASLGGQNEFLPATQMVVILWIIFFSIQSLIRIIYNNN